MVAKFFQMPLSGTPLPVTSAESGSQRIPLREQRLLATDCKRAMQKDSGVPAKEVFSLCSKFAYSAWQLHNVGEQQAFLYQIKSYADKQSRQTFGDLKNEWAKLSNVIGISFERYGIHCTPVM